MKNKPLVLGIVLLALGAGLMVWNSTQRKVSHNHVATPANTSAESPVTPRVPAYQLTADVKGLHPTLAPNEFFGKAREGYAAAKAIPEILAQLPCYCHCDQSLGHKSLHTCFESDHASHCVICIDEALLALKLQKEDHLSPEQIRQTIIAKYSE
jgi:uncharacterized protein with PCYCGC motif